MYSDQKMSEGATIFKAEATSIRGIDRPPADQPIRPEFVNYLNSQRNLYSVEYK